MRTMIWISIVSAALIGGAACKKQEEPGKAMERAATSAQKAQEDVTEQAKDLREQAKDVTEERKDVTKEQADVTKEQRELGAARTDLAQARERYSVATSQRLTDLDAKIRQIEMKADPAAKDTAAKLRARRDDIAMRLQSAGGQTETSWDAYTKDLDDSFDKLEKDTNDALK